MQQYNEGDIFVVIRPEQPTQVPWSDEFHGRLIGKQVRVRDLHCYSREHGHNIKVDEDGSNYGGFPTESLQYVGPSEDLPLPITNFRTITLSRESPLSEKRRHLLRLAITCSTPQGAKHIAHVIRARNAFLQKRKEEEVRKLSDPWGAVWLPEYELDKWLSEAIKGTSLGEGAWSAFAMAVVQPWWTTEPHLSQNLLQRAKEALQYRHEIKTLADQEIETFWDARDEGPVRIKQGYDFRTAKPYKFVWTHGQLVFNGWPRY